jgi:heme oxygenase
MLLTRLRQQTAALHREVEQEVDLLSPTLSRERYIRILQAFHAFFIPCEAALELYCPESLASLWRGRSRAHRLQDDLRFLDSSPIAAAAGTVHVPDLSDPGTWLGALYVTEGSTLGGRIIARYLESHFGWCGGQGYSFFCGYGDNTAAQWRSLCSALEDAAPQGNQIISGAHLTFVNLRCCLRLLL